MNNLKNINKIKKIFIPILVLSIFGVVLHGKPVKKPSTKKSFLVIDTIVVEKKKRLMSVFYKKKLLKTYKIALGFAPCGHKEQEGDGKTPEGFYSISHKNPKSQFSLSLKVSYPNQCDQRNARTKDVNPGGDIFIHGLGKSFGWLGKLHVNNDWTLGCIAVTNEEIAEIYASTPIGTIIEIQP